MTRLQVVINEISNVNKEIGSYNNLISKLVALKDKVKETSTKLKDTYTNLSEGLVINGDSVDGGAIEAMSLRLSGNSNELQNITDVARKERDKLSKKLTSLYAEKRRLEAEERRIRYNKTNAENR